MSLDHDVLHAFERACAEGDNEVAEKLLQALEVIDARNGQDDLDSCLARAYLVIADGVPQQGPPRQNRARRVSHRRQ